MTLKILAVEGKCITTFDYNNFTRKILDARIKQNELVNKFDITNLVKDSDLNAKLGTLATKAESKAEKIK